MTGAQTGNPPIMPGGMDAAKLLSSAAMRKEIMRGMGSRDSPACAAPASWSYALFASSHASAFS